MTERASAGSVRPAVRATVRRKSAALTAEPRKPAAAQGKPAAMRATVQRKLAALTAAQRKPVAARIRTAVLALLLVAAPASVAGAEQKAVHIDGLAALVGGLEPAPGVDTILQSDVELYALIELGGEVSGPLPTSWLHAPLLAPLMRAALQKLIGEHIIAREAERVRVSEPRVSDIARERRRLERKAGGSERLEALIEDRAVSKRELESILLRRARVSAFLQANPEASRSPAAGPERGPADRSPAIDRRQAGQPGDSAGSDPDGAGSPESTLQKAAERWIRVLMSRTPVRLFGEYAP